MSTLLLQSIVGTLRGPAQRCHGERVTDGGNLKLNSTAEGSTAKKRKPSMYKQFSLESAQVQVRALQLAVNWDRVDVAKMLLSRLEQQETFSEAHAGMLQRAFERRRWARPFLIHYTPPFGSFGRGQSSLASYASPKQSFSAQSQAELLSGHSCLYVRRHSQL